jgi:hypothetical protein
VSHIGVLLEPQLAVVQVEEDAAERAAERPRERQVVGRGTLVDVEPIVAGERRRIEPAAQAADVVADEEPFVRSWGTRRTSPRSSRHGRFEDGTTLTGCLR